MWLYLLEFRKLVLEWHKSLFKARRKSWVLSYIATRKYTYREKWHTTDLSRFKQHSSEKSLPNLQWFLQSFIQRKFKLGKLQSYGKSFQWQHLSWHKDCHIGLNMQRRSYPISSFTIMSRIHRVWDIPVASQVLSFYIPSSLD